jgi:hypothetical protein
MNKLNRDCYVIDFCLELHPKAEAVQAMAAQGDVVLDIAEFRLADWGADRADGVLGWADAAPGDRLTLTALRRTGERCGADEVWEQLGTMELAGDRPVLRAG